MIKLVTGPPDSGKSLLAEELALSSGCKHRYYIATMRVMDETGSERVRKHRAMREGKGFVTLEMPVDITEAVKEMETPEESVVLLECVANLAGNMMYDMKTAHLCRSGSRGLNDLCGMIASDIKELSEAVCELVVVTSVYEPQPDDDEDTALYKIILDMVDITLRDVADMTYDTGEEIQKKG